MKLADYLQDAVDVGDQMQSALDRLVTYLNHKEELPYEERMAMSEARYAIDDWTELRRRARG